jgi:hypothetical protein
MREKTMAEKRDETESTRTKESFTVEQGVLRANTDLYWNHLEEFETACAGLLERQRGGAGRDEIELDLTDVNFISSSFLGCLNNLLVQAGRLKVRVALKVGQDVAWLFEIMGSRRNLDIRVV